jgi:hypothetical protein
MAVDSVMARVNFRTDARRKWKKKGKGKFELKKPGESRPSRDPALSAVAPPARIKIINVVVSGWAYDDGLPAPVHDFILSEACGKPVTAFYFHLGINTIRGDLTKLRDELERAKGRKSMVQSFEFFVA